MALMLFLYLLFLAAPLFAAPELRFQVAEISLIGNHVTKPWVIERELHFDVEDSVSVDDLEAARLRLLSLGIFNNVRVDHDEEGAVTVEVSEQFRFIPVFGADAVEGSFNDALKEPKRLMEIIVFTVGVADLNHTGAAATVNVLGEFGARSGVSVDYRTRWLAQRMPYYLGFGLRSLRISDRHAAVLGVSRKLRNDRAYLEFATRSGAPSRLGLALRYDHVKEEDRAPADGNEYHTAWANPYIVFDRRNLEWYPTDGVFVRGDLDQAFGTIPFTRSRAVAAAYLPLVHCSRGPAVAARAYGGTTQDKTPPWARYYFGFGEKFRGYSSVKTEAANYLAAECELRFPITREITYDVPLVGRYGQDIPFWLGGSLFMQRAQTQIDGTRTDMWAYGAALHIRFPYVQILEASIARNRDDDLDLVFSTGLRF
ncbi:MAG: BamA/TamA family outer membrane protein [bacterium]|nr:BamA/TamA family outer membrane protein [bacterium]